MRSNTHLISDASWEGERNITLWLKNRLPGNSRNKCTTLHPGTSFLDSKARISFHRFHNSRKASRSKQNYRAYKKRRASNSNACRDRSPSISPIFLPDDLLELAGKPLPCLPTFSEALRGGETVDESLLTAWNRDPPYHHAGPDKEEAHSTEDLVDALLGRNLRVECKSRRVRAARCRRGETNSVLDELDEFILAELGRWPHYKVQASDCPPGHHKEVANALLFWHAYVMRLRYLEGQALENGDVLYLDSSY